MMPPSIAKYGSPIRLDAQIVALRLRRPLKTRANLQCICLDTSHRKIEMRMLIALICVAGIPIA